MSEETDKTFMNEMIGSIINELKPLLKIGICIDTCHIFVAGNDIRTQKNINNFFETIDKTVGIDKIKLCHLNDSKNKLGSRIDRHEKIGKGYIGQSSINQIIKFLDFIDVPMINEF